MQNELTAECTRLTPLIEEAFSHSVEIRRLLHQNPELSSQEEKTEQLICQELDELGIEYRNHVAGHGVVATIYGQNPARAVGIRADIDALPIQEQTESPFKSRIPGVMHACGHDLHTASLLGTARVLKQMEAELPYSVHLFFEPTEETTGGALPMIEEDCLKDPETPYVIGFHNDPLLESGKVEFVRGAMNAASTEFFVTVRGKSCHGAHPHTGIDPLIPACQIVLALQTIVSRRIEPVSTGLITVGSFHSGTKENIIPGETSMSGIIRTLSMELREWIKTEIESTCQGICQAHGATCEVRFRDSYPLLQNDDALLAVTASAVSEILGAENVKITSHPVLSADDFSYFCQTSKGLYFNVGAMTPGDSSPAPLHSDYFHPDEACIRTGIQTEVFGTLGIMRDASLWVD